MLILPRKIGEQVQIGDAITVTVLDVDGEKVRLGIEVPRDVPVYRPDVRQQIEADQARRASGGH